MEMLGNGLPQSAVEVTLEREIPARGPREILDVIRWAVAHNPGPSAEPGAKGFTPSLRNGFFHRDPFRQPPRHPSRSPVPPCARARGG